ncbi:hypothetical protein D0T49_02015 [Paludibacter sp. 221]|uniref:hypothetical protein n=1 Tax=Paludibacter sp. 221 TaxID=2302939 RepID=UPI0013D150F2|nr:hypothetical protein [Paludibacter sp. 221]NDV45826.1 hypothetical protein [Paludibacter sp. 221]
MNATDFALEQIKKNYDMPFLYMGMNVVVIGAAGKVTGVSNSGLKAKLFDDDATVPFHPTWETCYFDSKWNIVKDYRKKKNI